MPNQTESPLRLAEVLASLSLAIDLGTGHPMEWVIQTCVLGVRLAQQLNLNADTQRDVYYLSLLRHVGCTGNAHDDALRFGNELEAVAGFAIDMDDLAAGIAFVIETVGKSKPPRERLALIAKMLAAGPGIAKINHLAQCEIATRISELLEMPASIRAGLWQIFERWDGKGDPKGLQGAQIDVAVRVITLAQDVVTFYRLGKQDAVLPMVRARARRYFDPAMAEAFLQHADALLDGLNMESLWQAALDVEPGKHALLADAQFEQACYAIADFADLKSPFTLNHSRHVAELAYSAARAYSLPESDAARLKHAALLHDVGRVGVTAAIWGKPSKLTETEWERVYLHPHFTERIFARSRALAPFGALAAAHHERLDGSGYHHHVNASALSVPARLLAVCDVYAAMTEERAHRPAHAPEAAAQELRQQARFGKLDAGAVDAVLNAAGHRAPHKREAKTDLSEREIQVLQLLTRGMSNREMASRLIISPKTVGHHVEHIYNKLGVSTRAGATLYAMQNQLL